MFLISKKTTLIYAKNTNTKIDINLLITSLEKIGIKIKITFMSNFILI